MPSSSQYVCPSSLSVINVWTSALGLSPEVALLVLAFFDGEEDFACAWRFGAITLAADLREVGVGVGVGVRPSELVRTPRKIDVRVRVRSEVAGQCRVDPCPPCCHCRRDNRIALVEDVAQSPTVTRATLVTASAHTGAQCCNQVTVRRRRDVRESYSSATPSHRPPRQRVAGNFMNNGFAMMSCMSSNALSKQLYRRRCQGLWAS